MLCRRLAGIILTRISCRALLYLLRIAWLLVVALGVHERVAVAEVPWLTLLLLLSATTRTSTGTTSFGHASKPATITLIF